jgi:sugar phosphate isomerase/epimerase
MELGIFAKIFQRSDLSEVLQAVRDAGFTQVQFNVESAGLPVLPNDIPDTAVTAIREAMTAHGIAIAALSGTYNMIHPDPALRERDFRRFSAIVAAARPMGASIVTLCTGTRDPDNMWRRHPANDDPDAWTDLTASMAKALAVAETHDVHLAFEPEPGNTINSSAKARRLLNEMRSDRLGVVIDAVNTIDTAPDRPADEVLNEAFTLLSDRILVAHGKDLNPEGKEVPTGTGIVPWEHYLDLLRQSGFAGPLIVHGLREAEVPESLTYLRSITGLR